jgi:hypothetical protein
MITMTRPFNRSRDEILDLAISDKRRWCEGEGQAGIAVDPI